MSMLPDGADAQLDDWTIFFLNQTPFNTIQPVLALDSPDLKSKGLPGEEDTEKPDLLCVLSLVRTKHDKTVERGARVLALAICTRHPFIQIFKPVLLMALDDYLSHPSQDCLARLFDAVNSMDFSGAPILSRHEKMIMRVSERKDIFAEKFTTPQPTGRPTSWSSAINVHKAQAQHRTTNSGGSVNSFEDGIMMRNRNGGGGDDSRAEWDKTSGRNGRERADTDASSTMAPSTTSTAVSPPSDSSFSLGGSAVWVGDESGLDLVPENGDTQSMTSTMIGSTTTARKRRSTDASSASSHGTHLRLPINRNAVSYDGYNRPAVMDTHFFNTTVEYKDHKLPIKLPLSTFSEEVGDYSLITLIKVFSSHQQVLGPLHPHLHSSGPQTHPIIILFNALITGKKIIFLGHKRPAGEVSSFVLAACALGSGCGVVLRGFIERAFPYANLNNKDEWESVPAYIAGVTNPIFESGRSWDLLLDISTGNVKVASDIHNKYPVMPIHHIPGPLVARSGTLKAEASLGSEEEVSRGKDAPRNEYAGKPDNADNLFIEDIKSAIEFHYGEGLVRVRFTEYVTRFVRLASRYEEDVFGLTKIGTSTSMFQEGTSVQPPQLGSGVIFNDEQAGMRELVANGHRIEAWRTTNSYKYYVSDIGKAHATNPIRGFDVVHQIFRLRHAKKMSDSEVHTIMRTLADEVKTYDQVTELLSYLTPHTGGLLPLGFGLFHQKESVREATVDLFNHLRAFPVGVLFLQSLNHFQRYAYVRQAHAREKREQLHQQQYQQQPVYPAAYTTRTHSNSSASMSIGGHEKINGVY
ncbi:spindle pole body interacting protein [Dendrothele bispora CBS 962.96]|uniref:Spindle pole body interacting protein n=1 Tax=Dendrothele bispora (strain CBS 962.96) TaxID=1314807 RepID=A0A4S8L4Z9_DENBC|nr:spindle pole body interacting protein [Dendrothele bispora CBS 962.96]